MGRVNTDRDPTPSAGGFQCATCGRWHDTLPMDVGFAEPLYVAELSEPERARRVTFDGDFRVLRDADATHYFVRGVVEVPVIGTPEKFCFGAWSTLSADSYEQARAAYRDNGSAGPLFGWLANRFPGYATTLNLKVNVLVRPDLKPAIVLQDAGHALAREQRNGITPHRVRQVVEKVLHPDPPSPA